MHHYTAYIDEAGDEGFGKIPNKKGVGGQSRWLLLGACIVSRENDLLLPSWRDKILAGFPNSQRRDLHFKYLNHQQRTFVCQEIAKRPVGACVTFSNKATIPGGKFEEVFKEKGYLYNFMVRWLLERVTTVCKRRAAGAPCSLKIIFSRRSGTDYQSMMDYLRLMRDGRELMRPVRSIDWSLINIDAIKVENHKKWAGLQFADCITSAFFSAVERNPYGNYDPQYALLLKDRVLRSGKSALDCGVTPVPSLEKTLPDDQQRAFFMSFVK